MGTQILPCTDTDGLFPSIAKSLTEPIRDAAGNTSISFTLPRCYAGTGTGNAHIEEPHKITITKVPLDINNPSKSPGGAFVQVDGNPPVRVDWGEHTKYSSFVEAIGAEFDSKIGTVADKERVGLPRFVNSIKNDLDIQPIHMSQKCALGTGVDLACERIPRPR